MLLPVAHVKKIILSTLHLLDNNSIVVLTKAHSINNFHAHPLDYLATRCDQGTVYSLKIIASVLSGGQIMYLYQRLNGFRIIGLFHHMVKPDLTHSVFIFRFSTLFFTVNSAPSL